MKITDRDMIKKLLDEFEDNILLEQNEESLPLYSESLKNKVRFIISEEGISWYTVDEDKANDDDDDKKDKKVVDDDDDDDDDDDNDNDKKDKNESVSLEIPKLTDGDINLSEDFKKIFKNINIDEEVKTKLFNLFTINLVTTINEELAKYAAIVEDLSNQQIKKIVDEKIEELEKDVDKYLTYTVNEWVKENTLAIENSTKLSLFESMFEDMTELLKSYNLNIPDGSDDIIQQKDKEIRELEEKYKAQVDNSIELVELTEKLMKENIINDETKDLSSISKESVLRLIDNIQFNNNPDEFRKKIQYIKESVVNINSDAKTTKLDPSDISTDISEEIINSENDLSESMKEYIKHLKNNV